MEDSNRQLHKGQTDSVFKTESVFRDEYKRYFGNIQFPDNYHLYRSALEQKHPCDRGLPSPLASHAARLLRILKWNTNRETLETRIMKTVKNRICQICGKISLSALHPGILVRPVIAKLIVGEVGKWSEDGCICSDDLQKFRHEYVRSLLEAEKGELTGLTKKSLKV